MAAGGRGAVFRRGSGTATAYVPPTQSLEDHDSREWFKEMDASEFKPLLQEYGFDAPQEAEKAAAALLGGR
jgi:5-methylcytosine-specific restriction protein B